MKHSVSQQELLSGAKILFVDIPGTETFYAHMYLRSGFRFASTEKHELPHLLEHLAFDANVKHSSSEGFGEALESLGIYNNAFTNQTHNWYVLNGALEHSNKILDFLLLQVTGPLFLEADIVHQKQTIENELSRYLDDPGRLAWLYLNQLTMPEVFPTYETRIAGTKNITREDILAYYQKYYVTANMRFVIIGDIGAKKIDIITQIENGLSWVSLWESQKIIPHNFSRENHISVRQFENIWQAHFDSMFEIPGYDRSYIVPFMFIETMLNIGAASRLHKARKLGYTYGVGSGYGANMDSTGFSIEAKSLPENSLKLFELSLQELLDIASDNFSDAEFDRARWYLVGRFPFGRQTAIATGDWYTFSYLHNLPFITPEERLFQIKNCTREEIFRAAEIIFQKENFFTSYVASDIFGKKEEIKIIIERVFGKGRIIE